MRKKGNANRAILRYKKSICYYISAEDFSNWGYP